MNKLKHKFFGGRIGRAHYFWVSVVGALLVKGAEVCLALDSGIETTNDPVVALAVALALLGCVILALGIMISAGVRRAHDIGHSGWVALAQFIPFVGFYFLFAPGQKFANRWGPSPAISGRVESEVVKTDG